MSQEDIQLNNPLHGLKLDTLLSELVTHYGFDILAEYTRIKCFKNNPSMISSLKFLRKTEWARETLERFYLYSFKNLPEPGEDEFEIPPRQREIPLHIKPKEPKVLIKGEAIVPLTKDSFKETHRSKPVHNNKYQSANDKSQSRHSRSNERKNENSNTDSKRNSESNKPFDPYANAPR